MRTTPRLGVRGALTLLTAMLLAGCAGSPDTPGGHTASTTPSTTLDIAGTMIWPQVD